MECLELERSKSDITESLEHWVILLTGCQIFPKASLCWLKTCTVIQNPLYSCELANELQMEVHFYHEGNELGMSSNFLVRFRFEVGFHEAVLEAFQ